MSPPCRSPRKPPTGPADESRAWVLLLRSMRTLGMAQGQANRKVGIVRGTGAGFRRTAGNRRWASSRISGIRAPAPPRWVGAVLGAAPEEAISYGMTVAVKSGRDVLQTGHFHGAGLNRGGALRRWRLDRLRCRSGFLGGTGSLPRRHRTTDRTDTGERLPVVSNEPLQRTLERLPRRHRGRP